METIDKYTIFCTAEETKKALELGAHLEFIPMFTYGDNSLPKFVHKNRWNLDEFCYCPTAEQMIGWLRTKGFLFGISEYNNQFDDFVFWRVTNKQDKKWYKSDNKAKDPKEATLAAIDAALDYLSNKK